MDIEYRDTNNFTIQALQGLFSSVGWFSGNYPERLVKAMRNSSAVFSAWDRDRLVGLINAIDDGEMTAYVHYLLVNPGYQNMRIGSELINRIREKYRTYLYLILIAEDAKLIKFYERCGLTVMEGASPMVILSK